MCCSRRRCAWPSRLPPRELYAQAEEILVLDEAAIIPFYWYVKINMTAPNVERTFAADNAEALYEWDIN